MCTASNLTALDHGTSEAVLQADVGHFWGTSLPVGGESTHDKEHDGELIETLQAYLDCDKSANKAAEKTLCKLSYSFRAN